LQRWGTTYYVWTSEGAVGRHCRYHVTISEQKYPGSPNTSLSLYWRFLRRFLSLLIRACFAELCNPELPAPEKSTGPECHINVS
jgi:hypothetical protein